jgi:hypothetical protein
MNMGGRLDGTAAEVLRKAAPSREEIRTAA